MAIHTITKTFYHVTCDNCGDWAPGSPIRAEAIDQAIESGWQRTFHWNGLEHIRTDLCPDCFEEREAVRREADRTEQEISGLTVAERAGAAGRSDLPALIRDTANRDAAFERMKG